MLDALTVAHNLMIFPLGIALGLAGFKIPGFYGFLKTPRL